MTARGFREKLVKGIIEDDLAFGFAERRGMHNVFTYTLPKKVPIPKGGVVRADLDRLYTVIMAQLDAEFEVCVDSYFVSATASRGILNTLQILDSKISLATDVWSSKGCVFAFLGIMSFHITKDWELVRNTLNLPSLDGDHSGRRSAKLILRTLKTHGLQKKLRELFFYTVQLISHI